MSDSILLAYSFDGKGGGNQLEDRAVSEQIKADNLAWVHLDATHPDTKKWLETEVAYLDPFIIEALMEDETRPRMMQVDRGALLILRGVNLNQDASPEDMVSIRLWIDSHRIISIQRRKLKAISEIEGKIKIGKAPKDSGQFIGMLVSALFDRMDPVLTQLSEQTDNVEEKILEGASITLRESIVDIRKKAIMFRRYMAPQRDAIGQLRMSDLDCLSDIHKRQLQEAYNHIVRHVEDLDAIRERAQIVKDEIANILSDRLNKNMYVLSVIAAIFLPLGFLTGLLGINVGGIPGAGNEYAFWLFCGILGTLVALQVVVFKRLKWF
ncbi:MAG: zinc transporter [Halioglobus sp.]|jgi:zinc transporter